MLLISAGFVASLLTASPARADSNPQAEPAVAPAVQSEVARRAEIRRVMGAPGDSYLPAVDRKRRAMTAEERMRLREDVRANRDIYEDPRDGNRLSR